MAAERPSERGSSSVSGVIADALDPEVGAGSCPHLAVLLRTHDDLPAVLASFYGLGAKRNGWLAHRALPGEADLDRERLSRAGLQVADLEEEERLAIMEIDPSGPAEGSTERLERELDRALERGFAAAWYARFAVGPEQRDHEAFRPFEDAWDRAFNGRPVVTLCPFVVGEIDARAALERMDWLASLHDSVLLPGAGGGFVPDR
jgi:MEDS: MEthanogen/methylotroph, DcmR Sensory domain